MPGHDIIVLGASAGGVEALSALVSGLPRTLPAAVFVVVHIPATAFSALPAILSRRGPLPAVHARNGEEIAPGRIYVAPPDCHLLVHRGVVRLARGPRENGVRPAVDVLFRSAAQAYGPRVVGVVLSGALDDGTAGLLAIKHRGGTAVVQDPADAMYEGMPRSAVENVAVDHVAPLHELPGLLVELAHDGVPAGAAEPADELMRMEVDVSEMQPDAIEVDARPGDPSGFTCPECHGALWRLDDDEVVRYRCRVGHGYSLETLFSEQGRDVEAALWTAFRALRERAAICGTMRDRMLRRGQPRLAERYASQMAEAEAHAAALRPILTLVGGGVAEAAGTD